jgi:hypothetical protein
MLVDSNDGLKLLLVQTEVTQVVECGGAGAKILSQAKVHLILVERLLSSQALLQLSLNYVI